MAPRLSPNDVIDAAERLLDSEDITALSVRRLASELGVSRQVVYTHFDNMHGVLDAVHRRAGIRLTEAAAALEPAVGSDARVVAGAHSYIAHARDRPAAFSLLFGRPVPGYAPSVETNRALRAVFREHIVGLIAAWSAENAIGASESASFERARVFWSSIHGLVTLERAGHAEIEETDALVESLVGSLLAGWRAEAAAS